MAVTSQNHERHLQAALEQHLRLRGWRYYHAYNSERSVPGFLDIIALRDAQVFVAEIKAMRGRVTPAQREWLATFAAAGVPAYLWRFPEDWAQVERVLSEARG